jgi:hypothetical protein
MATIPDLFTEADPQLFDMTPTLAQFRAQDRLARAVEHFAAGISLVWCTDLQQFTLPPLTPNQVHDALRRIRGLRQTLAQLEEHVEDTMNGTANNQEE